jgi:hypothetical protein
MIRARNPSGHNPDIKSNANNQDPAGLKGNRAISPGRNAIILRHAVINLGLHRITDRGRREIILRRSGIIRRRPVIISLGHSNNHAMTCLGPISRRRRVIIPASG